MDLRECVTAYGACLALREQQMGYKTAHTLVVLKGRLKPHADFFAAEEMRLAEEYGAKGADGRVAFDRTGRFALADEARAGEYLRAKEELCAVEVQEEFAPQRCPAPESITPAQVEALQGFVEFE